MAKISARNAGIFAGGRNLTTRLNAANMNLNAEAPDATVFGDDDRERLSNGIKDFEFGFSGFYDVSASKMGDNLHELLTGSTYYGFYFVSLGAASAPGREFGGILTAYDINSTVEGVTAITGTVSGSSPVYNTMCVANEVLSLGSTTASNTSSVDFSGSCASQIAILRVFGIDAGATFSASFQNSTNDSSWSTLNVFTDVTSGCNFELVNAASAARYRRVRYAFAAGTSPISACFMVSSGSIAY